MTSTSNLGDGELKEMDCCNEVRHCKGMIQSIFHPPFLCQVIGLLIAIHIHVGQIVHPFDIHHQKCKQGQNLGPKSWICYGPAGSNPTMPMPLGNIPLHPFEKILKISQQEKHVCIH